ncbi:MAG: RNA polymerase sigma factor, partial [Myxococcales bacterium]|nr:RNA polymerase sigma factor [Myxococcales bacterium]
FRLIVRTIGQSADTDDVVQEVFVQVYRSLHKFRGEAKFSTWLYRLTLNVARMHIRKKKSRPKLVSADIPERPDTEDAAPHRPDGLAIRAEQLRALEAAVRKLSDKKRDVLVLHDLEGMAPAAIAEILEAPVLTIRTRLFYARKELYGILAEDPILGSSIRAVMDDLPGRPKEPRSPTASPSKASPEISPDSKAETVDRGSRP